MPSRPKRACLEAGCLGYAEAYGRCATHAEPIRVARARVDRSEEAGRRFYFTTRWRQLRAVVLRAEPLCRLCASRGRPEPATDVDHVRRHGGDTRLFWSRANLQPLCHRCHVGKTVMERRGVVVTAPAQEVPL